MTLARSLYAEPAYYAMMFDERTDDVRFYRDVTRGADAVLEYGVGSGRVAIPVALDGHEVVGVDTAPAMLDALAARVAREPALAGRVSWHCGDARALSLGRRFQRVLCPFNGLAHHGTRAEQSAFFARVREHLAPEGLFVFDVWLPNPRLLAGASTESPWFDDPRRGERVRCVETFEYDALSQMLTATLTIATHDERRPPEVLTTRFRQFFPEETLSLLDAHGFEVTWRTSRFAEPQPGHWDGVATESEDERGEMLAYVCRARESR